MERVMTEDWHFFWKLSWNGAAHKENLRPKCKIFSFLTSILFPSSDLIYFRKTIEEQLCEQLYQCEYIYEKTRIASKMNEQELDNYGKLASEIKKEIEQSKDEIQQAKEKLQKARIYRKNRMEYEVIANVINQQPERKDTHQKLTAIKKELSNLEVCLIVSALFVCRKMLFFVRVF